jgi:prolyl-tRNA editing enzyme YbaK/EbsC (Cys-tRNA(Pro) deacylase)
MGMSFELVFVPALSQPHLLAAPVAAALRDLPDAAEVEVAEIDPALADTAAFCERYGVSPAESANCVVIAAKRGGVTSYAACMVAATTRADVNGLVRRHLDARKASFAPVDAVTAASGMEYGGITPIGLPALWPVLVDEAVAKTGSVVIGSGIRGSKLRLPGEWLAALPSAQVLPGLGIPVAALRSRRYGRRSRSRSRKNRKKGPPHREIGSGRPAITVTLGNRMRSVRVLNTDHDE